LGKRFPQLSSLIKDYPELLKIPRFIPPEDDAESSYDSDATKILPQVEDNTH
jgi:hypothetical protein